MFPIRKILSTLSRYLAVVACVALTTFLLILIQAWLDIQIISLIFLIPVVFCTVQWGLTPGILTGFLSFLAFNYFFIQPLYTLTVHKTQDLITLSIFLAVSVVMSNLIGQAREGIRLAKSREWEATRMYELISTLSDLQEPESIAEALARFVFETFNFVRVQVKIINQTSNLQVVHQIPAESNPEETDTRLPLETVRGREGELSFYNQRGQLTTEEIRLLEAYTSQASLSIERSRLAYIERKTQILEESDKMKSSLLNSVSHELRTPLAAIKASVSSLRSGTVDWATDARKELLLTIEEEADHLNQLVGNLLDMSRIESGALNPQLRWNSLEEIVRGVAKKMRVTIKDHSLVLDLPDSLPFVPSDYVMIGQVFNNLISNSVKYAPPQTPITIQARIENEFVHVQVQNQGPPVPQEHLERIFDKFQQVMGANQVTGTGLGLSICKGIIDAHGGKIWAENIPHRFIFHFTLPLLLNGSMPAIPQEDGNG